MKIKLIISETENLFFFVSNLSNWHFSCRSDYNVEWLKESGKLTLEEKKSLTVFKKIITKYGFYNKNGKFQYLGQPFFIPKEKAKWPAVKKFVTIKEYEQLRKIFLSFKPRFKKVWRREKIKAWEKQLSEKIYSPAVKNLFSDIKRFIAPTKNIHSINVHLLASPSKIRTVAGSANLGNKDLTLEVPIYTLKEWDVEHAVCLLTHEVGHIYLENTKIPKIIKQIISVKNVSKLRKLVPERDPKGIMKEIIVSICAPYGYFCSKYFKKYESIPDLLLPAFSTSKKRFWDFEKEKNIPFRLLLKYLVWRSYPITAFYDTQKMSIDKEFIKEIITFLK